MISLEREKKKMRATCDEFAMKSRQAYFFSCPV